MKRERKKFGKRRKTPREGKERNWESSQKRVLGKRKKNQMREIIRREKEKRKKKDGGKKFYKKA